MTKQPGKTLIYTTIKEGDKLIGHNRAYTIKGALAGLETLLGYGVTSVPQLTLIITFEEWSGTLSNDHGNPLITTDGEGILTHEL